MVSTLNTESFIMRFDKITLVLSMLLTVFLINIDVTGMYVLMVPLKVSLHLSSLQVGWVASMYLLAFAAVIVMGGRLGDLYGHRWVLISGLSIFMLASWWGGNAHHVQSLVISRFIQGLGAGLIWPNTTALILMSMPARCKGFASGILSAAVGLGLAAGPIVAGVVSAYFGWRWVFWVNVPLCFLVAVFLVTQHFPLNHATSKRLDYMGASLLALVLGAIVLSFKIPLFLVFIPMLLYVFYRQQQGCEHAILPLSLLKNPHFSLGCMLRFLTVMPFYITMMSFGLYFQQHYHLSGIHAGIAFLPMMLSIALLSPVGGFLVDRISAPRVLKVSLVLSMLGCIVLLFGLSVFNSWALMAVLLFPGLAFTLASPATLSLSIGSVINTEKGSASGVFYMVSIVAGVIGTSVCSWIMGWHTHEAVMSSKSLRDIVSLVLILGVIGMGVCCFATRRRSIPRVGVASC
jgi:MFS family permease